MHEQEADEQPTHTQVPVQEGMDSLELDVRQSAVEERRRVLPVTEEALEVIQRPLHLRHGRRDESGAREGASPGPIQFWSMRNSPGPFSEPRAFRINSVPRSLHYLPRHLKLELAAECFLSHPSLLLP